MYSIVYKCEIQSSSRVHLIHWMAGVAFCSKKRREDLIFHSEIFFSITRTFWSFQSHSLCPIGHSTWRPKIKFNDCQIDLKQHQIVCQHTHTYIQRKKQDISSTVAYLHRVHLKLNHIIVYIRNKHWNCRVNFIH